MVQQPPPSGPPEPPSSGSPSDRRLPGDGGPFVDWRGLLRNRFILAGLGLLIVLLLVTVVLVAIGGGDDGTETTATSATATPEADATIISLRGIAGEMLRTTTMHNGPSTRASILGVLPRGATVSVVGRNEDASWLQVMRPGSLVRGWVPFSAVDVEGDVSDLTIAGPGEQPDVPVPTNFVPIATEPIIAPTQPAIVPTEPPTATAVPPTATDLPPTRTRTAVPPTSTRVPPTRTPVPPTVTQLSPPKTDQ